MYLISYMEKEHKANPITTPTLLFESESFVTNAFSCALPFFFFLQRIQG